ncbi:hypothetical protein CPB84DRAFT_1692017, partial [Gymnopilus junonius]
MVKAKDYDNVAIETAHAFSSPRHPQRKTHKVTIRSKRVIPVMLGPSIPNRKVSQSAEVEWAKYMLVIFKPWRAIEDLKSADESWLNAYNAFESHDMRNDHRTIIKNMSILSECRDI